MQLISKKRKAIALRRQHDINVNNIVNPIITILSAQTSDKIFVGNRPPQLGGELEIMSPEAFKNTFGISWQEGMEGYAGANFNDAKNNLVSSLSSDELTAQISKILEKPEIRMAIYKIDDAVGHGVFAQEPIEKNTVIGIYSGCIRKSSLKKDNDPYAFGYFQSDYIIKPVNFRGITSFLQHLPNDTAKRVTDKEKYIATLHEELKQTGQNITKEQLQLNEEFFCIEFEDEKNIENVATANLGCEYIVYNGVPVIAFFTKRDIEPGEQLGFNYGPPYWLSRNQNPCYFDTRGQIISPERYRRIYGSIQIEGFKYTGPFDVLLNHLTDDSSLYVSLQNDSQKKVVSKVALELALYKAGALRNNERQFTKFNAEEAPVFSLREHSSQVTAFMSILEHSTLQFNRSHCNKNQSDKGYWRVSDLMQTGITVSSDDQEGLLNSKFFVKTGKFSFKKRANLSAWDACKSLVEEGAFGIINDCLWSKICYLLALQNYVSKPLFEHIFSQLTLSEHAHFNTVFSRKNRFGTNMGGILKFLNIPDYTFRHPYSDYSSLNCLHLPSGFLYFGCETLLQQKDIDDLLKEKYYEDQTFEELAHIQDVSANKLLEYTIEEKKFKTQNVAINSSNAPLFVLLNSTQNYYDLDAWIQFALKPQFQIFELSVFYDYHKRENLTVDAFSDTHWWRLEFEDGCFNPERSYIYPHNSSRHDRFVFHMFDNSNEHTRQNYSYPDRCKLVFSEDMLHVCSSIISFFTNGNFYEETFEFIQAFELIQQLRFKLLELRRESQLQKNQPMQSETKTIPKNNTVQREPCAREESITAIDPVLMEKLSLLAKKDACEKKKVHFSYRLGLFNQISIQDVERKKKDLLIFWHPDHNKSIIATEMCQEITYEAGELIEAIQDAEAIQTKLDARSQDLQIEQHSSFNLT